MLKKTTLSAIQEMLRKLIVAKTSMGARAGTELAFVTNACHTPIMEGSTFNDWYSKRASNFANPNDANAIADMATGFLWQVSDDLECPPATNIDMHDDYFLPVRDRMAELVRFNHNLARNVVTPIVKAIYDEVTDLQKQRIAKYANVLSITPSHYEKIWSSTVLNEMVEKFKGVPIYDEATFPNLHPLLDDDKVIEYLKTGVGRFDKEIDDFVKEVGVEFVVDVYRTYFAVSKYDGKPSEYPMRVNWVVNDSMRMRREVLVAHLLALGLRKKIIEGIEMPLTDYESTMAIVIEQTGRGICRVFETRDIHRRQKKMVLRWPAANAEYSVNSAEYSTIEVNEDIYNEWLQQGGRPEMVYGSYITDKRETPDSILEKADEYQRAWARRAALVRSAQRSDGFTFTAVAIRDAACKQINALNEEYLHQGTREPMHNALYAYLESNITIDSLDDLYVAIRGLVCDVMFPLSDAKFLLCAIARIHKESPDLDVNEAALLATIDLLARSVSSMIVINPK